MCKHPIEHVRKLAGEIGCRMVGTTGNQAAAEYITGEFERFGLRVEPNPFDCPSWAAESTRLSVNGKEYPVYANTFSPACDSAGALLTVGSRAELEAVDITGKIVLFYGDLAKFPISPKAFLFVSDRDRAVAEKLENDRPAGVLTVNPAWGMRWRIIEDPDLTVPSATVPLEVGLELAHLAGNTARLQIAAQRSAGTTANLVARLGSPATRRIVLMAHYDTKEDTVGAWDNASGVGVLLALAERLAQTEWSCSLEFVAFTGEEHWESPETDAYLNAYKDTFGEIIAAINMDGIGGKIATHTLATFAGSPGFEECVEAVRQRYPGVARVDPWPASNHWQFYSNGVPSVAITSVGPSNLYHGPHDTLEWISEEKLEEVAALVAELVGMLESHDPNWGRVSQE
ncbi:MAG: Zn-dependent exopeptidase M28 [Chloroflexi bacterium]|nr:MAG: Zn-dependent exopeptidase M28 [Chloroflexota bacterium]